MSIRRLCALAAMGLALAAAPASGQETDCRYSGGCTAWWGEELAVIGGNVLIGALTAGLWQELRGGSFQDGFTRGALGGAVGYAGKRIVSARFPGAGLLGREVAAVGHSVIRNAAEGRGTFSRVALPLLFLPARVQLGDWGRDAPVRLDAIALWYFAYGLAEPRLELDWGRSLSWGAAVFVSDGYDFGSAGRVVPAGATVGTIFVNSDVVPTPASGWISAHERVHVAQSDLVILAWGDAADDWLESRVGPLAWISRFVAPNALTGALFAPHAWLQAELDHWHLPWELEAMALTGRVP
jgi:hypothetical protein